ncbi:hypothetical protein [Saccharothrix texasensis]|uniref:Uncharacterized protein n=1 Tax=Saccharothrix texasensis TaxID=103734 RepID=A0A3N1HDY2_9PSEU|nr:hypothetical protein [Saccharothrix texasensis]ROP40707.1 hypothetical protein EDD40_6124 [Saccharothrix texasensis]
MTGPSHPFPTPDLPYYPWLSGLNQHEDEKTLLHPNDLPRIDPWAIDPPRPEPLVPELPLTELRQLGGYQEPVAADVAPHHRTPRGSDLGRAASATGRPHFARNVNGTEVCGQDGDPWPCSGAAPLSTGGAL